MSLKPKHNTGKGPGLTIPAACIRCYFKFYAIWDAYISCVTWNTWMNHSQKHKWIIIFHIILQYQWSLPKYIKTAICVVKLFFINKYEPILWQPGFLHDSAAKIWHKNMRVTINLRSMLMKFPWNQLCEWWSKPMSICFYT